MTTKKHMQSEREPCGWIAIEHYEKVVAERDELLAALKWIADKMLSERHAMDARDEDQIYQHVKSAIAKAATRS